MIFTFTSESVTLLEACADTTEKAKLLDSGIPAENSPSSHPRQGGVKSEVPQTSLWISLAPRLPSTLLFLCCPNPDFGWQLQ